MRQEKKIKKEEIEKSGISGTLMNTDQKFQRNYELRGMENQVPDCCC